MRGDWLALIHWRQRYKTTKPGSLPGFIIILLCIYLPGGAQVAFTRLPRPTNLRQWGVI